MHLRSQFRLSIAVLTGFQLLTAFGAIGLLSRMGPAIAAILAENEYSIHAADEMLLVLARRPLQPDDPSLPEAFAAALERAKKNITEQGEPALVELLERDSPAALQGEPAALLRTVDALHGLIEINRQAMQRSDQEARRMGTAGAWSAVIFAVAGFAASIIIARRLAGRILDPLSELYEVTEAARAGDLFRRCHMLGGAPEMTRLLESVNVFLDDRVRLDSHAEPEEIAGPRAVALHLLDQKPEPAFVVDGKGIVALANAAGLDALSGPQAKAIREQLNTAPSGTSPGQGLQVTPIRDAHLWLCVVV